MNHNLWNEHAMQPHEYPRRILLAVTGLSPQVVTESVYALANTVDPAFVPTEFHLVAMAEGAEQAWLTLLSEGAAGFDQQNGRRTRMIPLVCGDPSHGPASFSRFVLPFAYHLEGPLSGGDNSSPRYVQHDMADRVWRERYLTDDTADALFHRARWFRLTTDGFCVTMTFRNAGSVQVRIAPPRVILFECPNAPGSDKAGKLDADSLRTGFLVLDLFFPNQDAGRAPTLDDLLDLNELFRYWHKPYVGHDTAGHKGYGYADLLAACPVNLLAPRKTVSEACTGVEKYFELWASLLECPVEIAGPNGKERYALSPTASKNQARRWVEQADGGEPVVGSGWIVYADHRTFVWTCAVLKDGARSLWDIYGKSEQRQEGSASGCKPRSQEWQAHSYGH